MGRLIVVSNRVGPRVDDQGIAAGGSVTALAAALRGTDAVWFGWSGRATETFTGRLTVERGQSVTMATVDLEEQDIQDYDGGYANRTLRPLFHYRIDLSAHERSFDQGYARVNARFAETLLPLIQPDDILWVHDYHLIPLGRELRRRGVKNRIGFFLHTPWPARRLFTTLPGYEELLESLLDYDLLGFQSRDSMWAFRDLLAHQGGSVSLDGQVRIFGRTARLGAFPIGLDVKEFAASLKGEAARGWLARMRQSLAGRRMIVGVDRLDYSKGLEERFLAYEEFLTRSPQAHEQVFLLQIANPSRDDVPAYQEIRGRLDAVTGRINGAFATPDWVPIRYVNRSYRREELAGIYRAAAIGLVTPLRDGMNLVAKEYVAAQDPADPGVLILSQFAGAAEQLEAALVVNPFSREDVSDAIRQGLAMPRTERVQRWESLIKVVREQDVIAWRDAFVAALTAEVPSRSRRETAEA